MSKSKPENSLLYVSNAPNPYCPVCGEVTDDPGSKGDMQADGHSCLLSILNAFYAGARKIEAGEQEE